MNETFIRRTGFIAAMFVLGCGVGFLLQGDWSGAASTLPMGLFGVRYFL
jgi:hypothetical protein